MNPSSYMDAIRQHAAALAVAGRADLAAVVPSCPGWTVRDVVTHVGGVHGWCRAIVSSGERAAFQAPPTGLDDEALVAWAEQQTEGLLTTLSTTDPDLDVWTFGQPRTVRFWLRRQAHETTIHAWDAVAALGPPPALDGELAADGLDEFVEQMVPRRLTLAPGSWTGDTIHIHRTDGAGEWLLTLGPDGSYGFERSHGRADAAVRGTASDLWLWALNRIGPEQVEVIGDDELIARWTKEITF